MGPVRVAIADDHKIFRKGVILSLRPWTNIQFVLEASNGAELIAALPEAKPDVVLMDLKMPVMDGVEATRNINRLYPETKIIVLTMFEDERYVGHLMENGANGYLLKNVEPAEIRKAILEVKGKGFYLNSFVNRALLRRSHARTRNTVPPGTDLTLNEKEKEVVQLICLEFTAAEIARKMEISQRTVEAIKDRLMERFGTRNTAGLVFFATKNHLVD